MERAEAKTQGLTTYETGRSCKHGHTGKRYTKTGACVTCVSDNASKWRKETGYGKTYYQDNRVELSKKAAERYKRKKIEATVQFYEHNEKLRNANWMVRLYLEGMHGDDEPEIDLAALIETILKGPQEYAAVMVFWLHVESRRPDEPNEAFRARMAEETAKYYATIKAK